MDSFSHGLNPAFATMLSQPGAWSSLIVLQNDETDIHRALAPTGAPTGAPMPYGHVGTTANHGDAGREQWGAILTDMDDDGSGHDLEPDVDEMSQIDGEEPDEGDQPDADEGDQEGDQPDADADELLGFGAETYEVDELANWDAVEHAFAEQGEWT